MYDDSILSYVNECIQDVEREAMERDNEYMEYIEAILLDFQMT